MNKREAALEFIKDNSRCLRENVWDRGVDQKTVIQFRHANGHGFFLMDMGEDGWTCFWESKKNNVDVTLTEFAEISGETFKWPEDETNTPPKTDDNE